MRVLLVDDDAIHLLLLQKIFERENVSVEVASSGLEALRILEFDPDFSVILTDMMMPGMDGVELLSHIQQSSQLNTIPIIGFTSGDLNFYKEKVLDQLNFLVSKTSDFYELFTLARESVA
jgi:CheY-like chemotaxis protein